MLAIGTFLGDRYEILEAIGSGGMADVYKAKDHKLNRFVAIKVLKSEFSSDSGFVSKFKAEAQAAAGLMHPNIVNVYDVGEERGMYYFVMELVEGITLKHYIEKKIRLTTKEAVSIAIQVSMGIEAAHNNGIIHRDIKPQNIIISKEGKVKVADFGIAKAVSSNTITSHAMGSVHYTSPEQARGGYSDIKSDIYSIGITLFEMVTGHVPFDGETTVAVAIKHIQEEMPSPKVYAADIPVSVEQIIFKCCQKNPDRRYQNVGLLIRDLKRSLTNPDENFVVANEPASNEGTKNISDIDKQQIRNQTVMSGPVYEEILPGRGNGLQRSQTGSMRGQGGPVEDDVRIAERGPMRDARYDRQYDGRQGGYDENYGYDDVFEAKKKRKRNDEDVPSKRRYEEVYEDDRVRSDRNASKKKKKREYDYYEDDALEDDVDPKMEKAVTVMMVIAAIIITIIAVVVVGNIFGLFSFGDSDGKSSGSVDLSIETSSGSDTIAVPNLVGMTVAEATDALNNAGLKANATYQESTEYDKDYIISQDLESGSSVSPGTILNLVVSSGKVVGNTVPDVVGISEAEAKVKLELEGFTMQKQLAESSDVEKGNVISQSPLGATTAPSGSTVTVVISSGAQTTQLEMPNLIGKNQEEAKVLIEEAGLTIRTISEENSDTVSEGCVISQSPSAGGTVEEGTSVDLIVSAGKLTRTYACSVSVTEPNNYLVGSDAIIVLMNPQGSEINRYSVNAFPYTISETGITDIESGLVTVTYLSNDGTWETTSPISVTFTPEG